MLLVDEKSQVGGAWGVTQVGDFGSLEIGCHIWSYNQSAYGFMQDFFKLNLIQLHPQPYFLKGKVRINYDHKNGIIALKNVAKFLFHLKIKELIHFLRKNPSARFPLFSKRYLYPKGGAREFQQAMIAKIEALRIPVCYNTALDEITKQDEIWELKAKDGTIFKSRTITLTSTSSIKTIYKDHLALELTHKLVNNTHIHLVINGPLQKPCPYVRVLDHTLIHRVSDITYQLENQIDSSSSVLLVGIYDAAMKDLSEESTVQSILSFLKKNEFIDSKTELVFASKNSFATSYIDRTQVKKLELIDKSLNVLSTTDLMYGIHYALPHWKSKLNDSIFSS
ncbi:MAG: hypothetical protein V4638_07620 [Bacteroidota bacterium]